MDVPNDRTWWIEAGHLLGGPFPGSTTPMGLDDKLGALLDLGICTFVSLMEPDETNHAGEPFAPYEPRVHQIARDRNVIVEFHRFPIRDQSTARSSVYRRILSTIDDSIDSGRPVYLHCWGGHGRTGTVAGCWLRSRGIAPNVAFDMIAARRAHSEHLRSMQSPETEAQRAVVRAWPDEPSS